MLLSAQQDLWACGTITQQVNKLSTESGFEALSLRRWQPTFNPCCYELAGRLILIDLARLLDFRYSEAVRATWPDDYRFQVHARSFGCRARNVAHGALLQASKRSWRASIAGASDGLGTTVVLHSSTACPGRVVSLTFSVLSHLTQAFAPDKAASEVTSFLPFGKI